MNELYNIFISYRTDPVGTLISQKISDDLKHMGYSVYHNSDRNHKGHFDERLRTTIENCKDFLLILSEECLAKLLRNEDVDWVREELLVAKKHNRNIIPVFVDGTELPKNQTEIPEYMRFLITTEAVSLPVEYNKLPPLQLLIGKLDSPKGETLRTRNVYNSNKNFSIDDMFTKIKEKANSGDRKSMYELASFYYYGYGNAGKSNRDYKKAFSILKILSDGNDIYASYADTLLARLYYDGLVPGEPQSYEKSFEYHKRAMSVCNYSAQQYAFMLREGSGCDYDFKAAEEAYIKATEFGDNIAFDGLAKLYMSTGRYKDAAKMYRSMSAFIQDSEYQLGMLYKKGVLNDPPKPDYFRAAFYFQHAIDSKQCGAEVYYQLACLYFNPTGDFPKDFKSAQKYFSIASDMGYAKAQYILAFMYECGHVKKDISKAMELYTKAADQGHDLSAVQLAFLYQQEGYISYDKAYHYAKAAAEHGVMEGEFIFGVLLMLGRGCEPDISKASEYLKKSLEHGIYQAKFFLDKLDEMERKQQDNIKNTMYYHFKGSFHSNDKFIGRKNELEELSKIMKNNKVCFIYGAVGIGKTEFVKKYASEHILKYDRIMFIQYTSDLTDIIISNQYFEIDGFERQIVNGEPETDENFCRRKLDKIKELLSGYSLIIIDDFDNENDPVLEEFLQGPYKVIITTRNDCENYGFPILKLDNMTENEQWELFKKYYGQPIEEKNMAYFKQILPYLSEHTLAIELAAGYAGSKQMKLSEMSELMKNTGASTSNTVEGYAVKLMKSKKFTEYEKTILSNLSLLPVSGIDVDSFIEWCELPDRKAIDSLTEQNWINFDFDNNIIYLHQIIAEMIKSEISDYSLCKTMLYNLDRKFSVSYYMKADERARYGETAKSIYQNISMTKENLNSFRMIFRIFKNLDCYTLCEEIFTKAIKILGNQDSVELAWWYWEYGDRFHRILKCEKALEYNQKAIDILERIYPDSYDLAYLYKHSAHVFHTIFDRIEKNSEMIQKAYHSLEKSEKYFKMCASNGHIEKISSCYSYAHDMDKDYDLQKASLYYAKGTNYYFSGDYEQAEYYSQQSLEIFERVNGKSDADTTAPMRVLARIYSKTNRHEKAIVMQKRVVDIRGKIWGKNQYLYYENLEILADLYYDAGRTDDAVNILRNIQKLINQNPMYEKYLKQIETKIGLVK